VIDESNVAPAISVADPVAVQGGAVFSYYPDITDPDDTEHTITYTAYPSWCAVQNDSIVGTAPVGYSVETLTVIAADYCKADTLSFEVTTFMCGDADQSGEVDIDDAVHLITYIFSGGPEPVPPEAGDVDCVGGIDIDDAVYLIAYIFSGGPEPCAECE
jgi:hypothetical protein